MGDGSASRLLGPPGYQVDRQRNKGPSRLYFIIFSVIFFALLLDSVISLGTFAVIQRRVVSFWPNLPNDSKCILFASYGGKRVSDGHVWIRLSKLGVCGYMLWGQVSVVIVAFMWMAYSIVMICVAPRM